MNTKINTKQSSFYIASEKKNRYCKTLLYASYIFIISLYIVSSPPRIMVLTLLFAAMHESAHIIMAKALGRGVSPFRFAFSGLYPDTSSGSVMSCLFIYAAGPLANLAAALIALSILRRGISNAMLDVLSVNALLFFYNLLPVPYSDGDGIIRTAFSFFLSQKPTNIICALLNLLFSIAVFSLFSYRFLFLGTGLFSFFCSFVFMIESLDRAFKG